MSLICVLYMSDISTMVIVVCGLRQFIYHCHNVRFVSKMVWGSISRSPKREAYPSRRPGGTGPPAPPPTSDMQLWAEMGESRRKLFLLVLLVLSGDREQSSRIASEVLANHKFPGFNVDGMGRGAL